jgi:hypothetical protein
LLSGHRWVSVFNFAKGFYACATAEEIRLYLCFHIEGRGLFTYCKMPMGLTGAPSTFGMTTGGALGDLVGTKIQLFVDDGGMAGDVLEDKMADLRMVFERVRKHKLSLSAQKMQFFMTEAMFAGNRVGPRHQAGPNKVDGDCQLEDPARPTQFEVVPRTVRALQGVDQKLRTNSAAVDGLGKTRKGGGHGIERGVEKAYAGGGTTEGVDG